MHLRVLGLALALVLTACSVPVAGALDEEDANRIVVALDHANVESTKEADPAVEGKFRVTVLHDDAARALVAMKGEELPRPKAAGVLDAVDKGALVPSPTQEHAALVAGIAGDLEKTLEGVDGVLSARVHLNVPPPEPLSDTAPAKTSASVLVEHRGATPPLTETEVARLVAGGVPNLKPQDIAVVMVARPIPPRAPGSELTYVGPIAVARTSMRMLQLALVGLVVLVAGLTAATLALFSKVRKLALEVEEQQVELAPKPR
jgi:type III secretion protein J